MKIAQALDINTDLCLALTGKVDPELVYIIISRPGIMSMLIRELDNVSTDSLQEIFKLLKAGKWQ